MNDWESEEDAEAILDIVASHSNVNRTLFRSFMQICYFIIVMNCGENFDLEVESTEKNARRILEFLAKNLFWPDRYGLALTTYEHEVNLMLHIIKNNLTKEYMFPW